MSQESEALKRRTEAFALAVIKLCDTIPNTLAGRNISGQLIDSATSVACNYRAACRGFTRPVFIAKLAVVAEEADESQFWLTLLIKAGQTSAKAAGPLAQEAFELTAIFTASLRTARARQKRS